MTKAECLLWKDVLSKKKLGHQFRRQRPIGPYIVDFACLVKMIIIEVDGESHEQEGALEYDLNRQNFLESVGFKVIRISNEEVLFQRPELINFLTHEVSNGNIPIE